MPGQKVRADFEQLTSIAARWGQKRDAVQTAKNNLQTRLNTLRNGDWVGDSAEVFYAEMDSVVFPALGRLVAALDDAAHTTLDIRAVMTQAELDVAAIFKERDAGGAGKGKGLASVAAPQPPWDADGFGWWADQFKLQHGRAPTDADYDEFQLSWKLSGEGKVQWTDADWRAFYEINSGNPSRLKQLENRGIKLGIGDGWTGIQLRDAIVMIEKFPSIANYTFYPPFGSGVTPTNTSTPADTQFPTPVPEPTVTPTSSVSAQPTPIRSWDRYQGSPAAKQYLDISKILTTVKTVDQNGKDLIIDFTKSGIHLNLCGPLMLSHMFDKDPSVVLLQMAQTHYRGADGNYYDLSASLLNPKTGTDYEDLANISKGLGWSSEQKAFGWPPRSELDNNKTPIPANSEITLKVAQDIEIALRQGKKIGSVNMLNVNSGRVSRDGKVSHWVEIVSIQPNPINPTQSRLLVYNPFQNRFEPYSLQEFSDSIDQNQKTSLIFIPSITQ